MRGSRQQTVAGGTIDLGNDPPLNLDEDGRSEWSPTGRAISWRWLTGTILTGVTSMVLMGAALVASLDEPQRFPALPQAHAAIVPEAGALVFGRKGDRMQPLEEQVSSRQVLQVSTVTRRGERDFIRLRPFARVSATLAADDDALAAEVPPLDVSRIFADPSQADTASAATSGTVVDDQFYGANVDGQVAVKVMAFPIANPDFEPAAALPTSAVEQIVRAAANFPAEDIGDLGLLAYADTSLLDGLGDGDPFADFGVRIVPENVSSVVKSDEGLSPGHEYQEKMVNLVEGVDLRVLLQESGATAVDADRMVSELTALVDIGRPNQAVRLAFAADEGANTLQPIRASIYEDGVHQATVARTDSSAFVRADEPGALPAEFAVDASAIDAAAGPGLPRIYDAVYQTALQQQMPKNLVEQLIRIFAFDVDLQARITPGDTIEVFHSLPDPDDPEAGEPEILFASLTLNGVPKRFYRFRTPDDGIVDYYDEDGNSAKKFLIRKPVPDGRMTSGYGYRVHPIVGKRILHTGVDYAVPRGTPILAAGDGVVEKAGRSSGYGNFTLIRHTNGYETAYGHQTSFAKGIAPGTRVHQGQVIGYVGSTGLSTGPHLHFEIRINGKPVDPLRIRLPRGRVLQGEFLTAFEHERQRIDALLGTTPSTRVASAN